MSIQCVESRGKDNNSRTLEPEESESKCNFAACVDVVNNAPLEEAPTLS